MLNPVPRTVEDLYNIEESEHGWAKREGARDEEALRCPTVSVTAGQEKSGS